MKNEILFFFQMDIFVIIIKYFILMMVFVGIELFDLRLNVFINCFGDRMEQVDGYFGGGGEGGKV